MKPQLMTARRTVDLPFIDDGRYYELTSGRHQAVPKFAKSPTAFACMNIRGQELANIPWHIKKGDKILDKHPLITILKNFGPESNWQRGILYTELDKMTYGAGLWLFEVDEVTRLDPSTIEVKKNKNGITGFWQYLDGPKGEGEPTHKFKRDEIVFFPEYHPEGDLDFGIPTLEVCKRAVNAEVEALQMIEAHYKNDAVPGLFLGTDQTVTEDEANRLLNWWNRRFRGSRNKGKVGIAGKGLKPVPVGSTMKDAAVVELIQQFQGSICKAFRVDPILVGGNVNATYENLNESRKFLIEDVLIPRAIEYQNVINQDLCAKYFPDVEFEFAFEEMKILQENSTEKHTRLFAAVQAGLVSDDFYREEMGYPAKAKPPEEEVREKEEKKAAAEAKWEKKAVKAFIRGESPAVPFETDNISIDRQYVIRGRLQNAKDEEAVRACFK